MADELQAPLKIYDATGMKTSSTILGDPGEGSRDGTKIGGPCEIFQAAVDLRPILNLPLGWPVEDVKASADQKDRCDGTESGACDSQWSGLSLSRCSCRDIHGLS